MTKIGIALGGGGVTGCAHIGVLKALEENGIEIHSIAGTSSGGLVAALYAYGYTADELVNLVPAITKKFLDYNYGSFIKKLWSRKSSIQGLCKGMKLHQFVSFYTNHSHMSDLKFPVALLAADLKRANKVIFSSQSLTHPCPDTEVILDIPVADAVQSSCAIPFIFQPVVYQDKVLVDGGVLDNCPVSILHAFGADKVIAVNLSAADPIHSSFDSCSSIISRVISIQLTAQTNQNTQHADIVLRPESRFGMLEFSKLQQCMELGYSYTKGRMNEIKKVLATSTPIEIQAYPS